jgi:hypothetical protein
MLNYTSIIRPASYSLALDAEARTVVLAYRRLTVRLLPNVTYIKLPPVAIEYDVLIYDDGYYQYTDANDQLRTD